MPRSDTTMRLARLDLLTSALQAGGASTVHELALDLGVSPRTIARDLSILRDRGLTIDGDRGRGGGVRLDRQWGVGRIQLDVDECVNVVVAAAIAEKQRSPLFAQSLGAVRRKLLAALPPDRRKVVWNIGRRILIGANASSAVLAGLGYEDHEATKVVRRAFVEMRVCHITYRDETGKTTQRQIEPHYLLVNIPAWYVLAFDRLRNDARCFRCDRIGSAEIELERFHARKFDNVAQLLETLAISDAMTA